MINKYLKDDTRRVLQIDDNNYIKRVYSENGIIFECSHNEAIFTTDEVKKVLEWYELKTKGQEQ